MICDEELAPLELTSRRGRFSFKSILERKKMKIGIIPLGGDMTPVSTMQIMTDELTNSSLRLPVI